MSLIVNGVLCDGNKQGKVPGNQGPRGWHYLPERLHPLGGCQLDVLNDNGAIGHLRMYPRALLTSEIIETKTAPRRPKCGSKTCQDAPRRPQDVLKAFQDAPRRP